MPLKVKSYLYSLACKFFAILFFKLGAVPNRAYRAWGVQNISPKKLPLFACKQRVCYSIRTAGLAQNWFAHR